MPSGRRTVVLNIDGPAKRGDKKGRGEDALSRSLAKIKDEYQDRLTPALWLREIYATPAVDRIYIRVFLPQGGFFTRTYLRDAVPFTPDLFASVHEPEAVELWLATTFGDGRFAIHAGRGQEQFAGYGPFPVNIGIKSGAVERVSARDPNAVYSDLMEKIAAKGNILNAQDMVNTLDRKIRGEDTDVGMKPSEFKEMAEGMATLMRAGSPPAGMDALLAELRAMREEMKGAASTTTPGLGAIIGPVAELLSKNPSGAWPFLRMFLNRVAPEVRGPVEPPSKTFMESAQELVTGLGPVIAQFAQTPFGQAIVAKLLQGVTPPPPNGTTVTEHPPIIEHEPQRPAIPPRPRGPFDDVLDAIVDQLRRAPDDRDFKALVGFLDSIVLDTQTDQRLLDRIAPIAKTTDELARVALRQIDARLVEQVWDGTRAFLDYLREHPREDDE